MIFVHQRFNAAVGDQVQIVGDDLLATRLATIYKGLFPYN